MSDGVSKSCDLSQILPIILAAISTVSMQLLQNSRERKYKYTFLLLRPFLCDCKMHIMQVNQHHCAGGDSVLVVKRMWMQLVQEARLQIRCSTDAGCKT